MKPRYETQYHVFSWDYKCFDKWFDKEKQAIKYYEKMVKDEPYLSWRLYRKAWDNKAQDFIEDDCLESTDV